MHKEEILKRCYSPNITVEIKPSKMRQVGYVARMGEMRITYKLLTGNPEMKRPFRNRRHRWGDNVERGSNE